MVIVFLPLPGLLWQADADTGVPSGGLRRGCRSQPWGPERRLTAGLAGSLVEVLYASAALDGF